MKKNIFLPALLLSFLTAGYLHAESIVMKSTSYGLEALSDEDIKTHGQVVSEILLKYSWPMCQDSDLTPKEQHELLSAEGNEQRFLEKKLNETIAPSRRNFDFAVIFVPTTLYELFCISELEKANEYPAFLPPEEICFLPKDFCFDDFASAKKHDSFPFPCIYTEPVSTTKDRNRLFPLIKKFNQQFYQHTADTGFKKFPILTSYRLFIEKLSHMSLFQGNKSLFSDRTTLSHQIKQNISALATMILPCSTIIETHLILNYIACEYQAHLSNKGLICRGTRQNPNNKTIASTLYSSVEQPDRFYPYSISFGSSLLAGCINAFHGGCVAFYLEGLDRIGYSLYIDKEKYHQNRINNLFLIQPLSSLANLFADAEHFHPRTIAAVKDATQSAQIKGLNCFNITGSCQQGTSDPAQVITIERKPLDHESYFLKYFINNYEIFQLPEKPGNETIEQRKHEIAEAQRRALSGIDNRIKN